MSVLDVATCLLGVFTTTMSAYLGWWFSRVPHQLGPALAMMLGAEAFAGAVTTFFAATSAVNAFMFLGLLAIAVFKKSFRRYTILGRFWRPDWYQFRQIFRVGTPIAGTMLLESGFFIGAVFVLGQFGAIAIAAHMIAIQLPHVTFMVPMGLSQAATVRVGQAVGRRDVIGA